MSAVYIISKNGEHLMPTVRYGHVRHLLKDGKAVVFSRHPFTIQLSAFCQDCKRILFSEYVKEPDPACGKAILRVVPKIKEHLAEINQIIDATPILSDLHKEYIKDSLSLRYERILQPALKKQRKKVAALLKRKVISR